MKNQTHISRIFDASLEDVWKLWTEPEYVKQWWGPDKFICTLANINFKEGSSSFVNMVAPAAFGGQTSYCLWTYTKIIPFERIEFILNLADEKGVRRKPVELGMPPDFPEDVKTVVTFKKLSDDQTEMTITEIADFGQMAQFAQLGLDQSADKAVAVFKKK